MQDSVDMENLAGNSRPGEPCSIHYTQRTVMHMELKKETLNKETNNTKRTENWRTFELGDFENQHTKNGENMVTKRYK